MINNVALFSKKTCFIRLFSSVTPAMEVEVERKFPVTSSITDFCIKNASHTKHIRLIDTYFDNSNYALTSKDMWLRERNGKWELKLPHISEPIKPQESDGSPAALQGIDCYDELVDDSSIRTAVKKILKNKHAEVCFQQFEPGESMSTWLNACQITPFVRLTSNRTRYAVSMELNKSSLKYSQNIFVDIDSVTFDSQYVPLAFQADTDTSSSSRLQYTIGEIELAPPFTASDRNSVMRDIFAALGLETAPVRGKLLEYLYRFRPEHYDFLRKSGQLQSKGISATPMSQQQ
jgi:hypothetical protein